MGKGNTLDTQLNKDAASLNAKSKSGPAPQLPMAEAVKESSLNTMENAPSAAVETNPVLKNPFPEADAVKAMDSNKLAANTQKSSSPIEQENTQKISPKSTHKSEAISLDD